MEQEKIIPIGTRFYNENDVLFGVECFAEYPIYWIAKLHNNICANRMTKTTITQLIGLIRIDSEALKIAQETGIHPITGCRHEGERRENQIEHLLKRNADWIEALNEYLK
jgi:hypothetical protein